MATTVFVVMIRGLFIKLNFPYATFPALNLTGEQIVPILMEATYRLELLGFKVIAHTLDGCSINRKYFKILGINEPDIKIKYRLLNPFSAEKRYIYFFSDPPHLMKTTRNCFYNPRRELEVIYNNNKNNNNNIFAPLCSTKIKGSLGSLWKICIL